MPAHNEQVYTPTTSWQPEGPHVDIPANQGFLINSHINEDRLVEVIGDRLNPPVPAGRPLLTTNKIIFVLQTLPLFYLSVLNIYYIHLFAQDLSYRESARVPLQRSHKMKAQRKVSLWNAFLHLKKKMHG